MIDAPAYLQAVKTYFSFLATDFTYTLSQEVTRGNVFYDVQYRNLNHVISISYENLEDYLQVIVFELVNQQLPKYDDKRYTLHLRALNQAVIGHLSPADRAANKRHFQGLQPQTVLERQLLKSAQELRLGLVHFDKLPAP